MQQVKRVSRHKFKGRNSRPCRTWYWQSAKLAKHKTRNLRCNNVVILGGYLLRKVAKLERSLEQATQLGDEFTASSIAARLQYARKQYELHDRRDPVADLKMAVNRWHQTRTRRIKK